MDTFKEHNLEILEWYLDTAIRAWDTVGVMTEKWDNVLECIEAKTVGYEFQKALNELDEEFNTGDSNMFAAARFFIWSHSTNPVLRKKLNREIRISWAATEWMKEQVMNG